MVVVFPLCGGKRLASCLALGYGAAGGGAGIRPGEAEAQSPGSDPSGDMGFQAREYSLQNPWENLAVRLRRRRVVCRVQAGPQTGYVKGSPATQKPEGLHV